MTTLQSSYTAPDAVFSNMPHSKAVQVRKAKCPQARVHMQLVPLHPIDGKPFDSFDDFVHIASQAQYAKWTQQVLQPVAALADALQLTHECQGYRLAADNLPTQSNTPFAWHLFGGQPLNKTLLRAGEIGHAPFCDTAFTQQYNKLEPTAYGKQFSSYFINEQIDKSNPQLIAHNATACSFPDKVPQLKTHVLVISAKPYVSSYDFSAQATASEIRDFFAVTKQTIQSLQLQGKPYRLATNAGKHANHMVPHFHMHIGHDPAALAPLVVAWSGHNLRIPPIATSTFKLNAHQVQQQVQHLAKQLRMQGVTPGQRVALCSDESIASVLGLLSCWQVGAAVALCSPREPQSVLKPWLKQLGCRCLLATKQQQDLLPDAPFVPLPQQADLPSQTSLPQKKDLNSNSYPVMHAETTAGTLLRTSGSTAQPKTALHTLQHHLANAKQAARNVHFGSQSRWLLSLPLHHVGGLGIVCRALVTGGSLACCQSHERLSVDLLQRLAITHLSVVTTQLHRLLQQQGAKQILSQLTAVLVGGGPLYPHVLQRAVDWGVPITTTYGCTEMASQITASNVHSRNRQTVKPLTSWHAGPVLPDRQLRIQHDGEILVKGLSLFCGYVRGKHVDPARDQQGWFHTSDLGFLDDQGNLHIQGRKDNRLVSGGENIQAEEIEHALLQHPFVQHAVVVAKPCKQFGQRPVAFIKMVNAAALEPHQLRQHLEHRIARFKIPDTFLPWPQQIPCNMLKPPRAWLQSSFLKNIQ